jgi:hypothetical protein
MAPLPDDLPEPLEQYASLLDSAFSRPSQRASFRAYLRGLLLGTERNKTSTGLANTEPGLEGSKHRDAQRLQWFLAESTWEPEALHDARLALMRTLASTRPTPDGVLVVDETGDRKYGTHTAHVGRQYLGSLGKVDSGVVTVHVLYATERAYFPLRLLPYTPAHHFESKANDPAFRTKPQLAVELIDLVRDEWPFRAVVADNFYGRNDVFQHHLIRHRIPFVLALPASHTWWHRVGEVGGVQKFAELAPPQAWQPVAREYADGHRGTVWVAELNGGPFGPAKTLRLVVVTSDPVKLPGESTEYLISNLRASDEDHHERHALTVPATAQEVALLYSRRVVVEQAYREVKGHLGWAACQARSDLALRRHWALVCAAFCFLWWYAEQHGEDDGAPPAAPAERTDQKAAHVSWSAWLRRVRGWLEPFVLVWRYWKAFTPARPPRLLRALLEGCRRGTPLYTFAA